MGGEMYSKKNDFVETMLEFWAFIIFMTAFSMWFKHTVFSYDFGSYRELFQSITISAMLTLWTIIVAVLVYYLGRKDEKFYGFSGWQILSFGMTVWQKRCASVFLFMELIFTLLFIVFWCPAAVVLTVVILLFALACSFYIVAVGTQPEYLNVQIKEMLTAAAIRTTQGDTCRELMTVLRNLDYSREADTDFLLEILEYCFCPAADDGKGDTGDKKSVRKESLWLLYRAVRYALLSMDKDTAEIFIKNFLLKSNDIDLRTVLIFPVQELQEQGLDIKAEELISVIEEEYEDNKKLILRMIVYEIWLEEKRGIHWRNVYIVEYIHLLEDRLMSGDIDEMLAFYMQICAYQNENVTVQNGIQRIMELQG